MTDRRIKTDMVRSLPGFELLWDFHSRDALGRFPAYTRDGRRAHPLEPANLLYDYWSLGRPATAADIPVIGAGPFGSSVFFDADRLFSRDKSMRPYLKLDREAIENTPIDVKGRRAFTLVAWIARHCEHSSHFIAGVWHEGTNLRDCTRIEEGQRQYALFGGLAANPGAVSGHVSDTGGGSFGGLYARHMAVTRRKSAAARFTGAGLAADLPWITAAVAFDPSRNLVRASIDGCTENFWCEAPEENRFYRHHLADPGQYAPPEYQMRRKADSVTALRVNPYWFDKKIFSPAPGKGAPFTVGRAICSFADAGFTGLIGGVALFSRSLETEQLAVLSSPYFKGAH